MKKLSILISMTLAFVFLNACKVTRILPDEPTPGNLLERPERLNSQITIPLEIDISTLEAYINQQLPSGRIEQGSGRSGNTTRYSYEVFRNRPVRFTAQGNELIFKVPIDIRARGSYTACVGFWRDGDCCSTPNPFGDGCLTPGVTTTEHGNAAPTVDLELRVKLAVKEDYSVQANTYLKGSLSGDPHLHIDLIGNLIRININIKDKLEGPLQDFIDDYQDDINEKVAQLVQQFDLKGEVAKYWNDVKQPVQLGDLWLDIQPKQVIFENLNAQSNKLRVAVGVASQLQVVSQEPTPADAPLPNLTLSENTQGIFNIYLPASASYDLIEAKIKESIDGQKYEKDGVTVKVKDIDIRGVNLNNANTILVNATVKGKAKFKRFKGNLYFTALPGIDDSAKTLFISDFRIEPNTNSFLINHGLPYLVDNFYYEEIKANLSYSYKEHYDKYFALINEQLRNIEVNNLIINGELQELKVPGFYIGPDEIEVLLIANGKLSSQIQLELAEDQ